MCRKILILLLILTAPVLIGLGMRLIWHESPAPKAPAETKTDPVEDTAEKVSPVQAKTPAAP